MGQQDFQGIFKYKLIMPSIQVLTWVFIVIGPMFYYEQFKTITIAILLYLVCKTFYLNCMGLKSYVNSMRVLDRIQNKFIYPSHQHNLTHCFVFPSYNEGVELLSLSLNSLANHQKAKQYVVFMALEQHQKNVQKKAAQLVKRFQNKFKLFKYTLHKLVEGQQRGKASNVCSCLRQIEPFFIQNNINPTEVLVTIADADTLIPNVYCFQIEEYLAKNNWNMNRFIFAPNQMYTRNHMDVPFFNRVHDQTNSTMQFLLSTNFTNTHFPLSNYSISYLTLKNMGFHDTNPQAIGEDYHTTMKAFWKYNGQIQLIPIYITFNLLNLQTGNGYVKDVIARFWQAQRHVRGIFDVAYNIKMFLSKPFNFRSFWMMICFIQLNLLGMFSFWFIVAFGLYNKLTHQQVEPFCIHLFQILTIINISPYVMYFLVIRRTSCLVYGFKKQSLFRVIQYAIAIGITVPMFLNIALIFSLISTLKGAQYIAAQKKNPSTNQQIQEEQLQKLKQ